MSGATIPLGALPDTTKKCFFHSWLTTAQARQKMVREVKTHAQKDQEGKTFIDLRNNVDPTCYDIEQSLNEYSDRIPSELVSKVESAVSDLRRAAGTKNVDNIKWLLGDSRGDNQAHEVEAVAGGEIETSKVSSVVFTATKLWLVVEAPKANDVVLKCKAAFGADLKRKAELELHPTVLMDSKGITIERDRIHQILMFLGLEKSDLENWGDGEFVKREISIIDSRGRESEKRGSNVVYMIGKPEKGIRKQTVSFAKSALVEDESFDF
ncbi:mitochondrial heat shock protein 70-1 [Perilla frutescens var. frutescens]|nr:mitochondrial heat shock protein 70-1 [Perilla frutescens var. frutescens]